MLSNTISYLITKFTVISLVGYIGYAILTMLIVAWICFISGDRRSANSFVSLMSTFCAFSSFVTVLSFENNYPYCLVEALIRAVLSGLSVFVGGKLAVKVFIDDK